MNPVLHSTTKIAGARRAAVSSKLLFIADRHCPKTSQPAITKFCGAATLVPQAHCRSCVRVYRGDTGNGSRFKTSNEQSVSLPSTGFRG
ncbi:hypothetical protein chiPu_0033949 [Chiloscyllium punctatum]|uniref:Uncharacterized protein n=1 Tax=Chiloscyllium punctatum TaxID=137246 RepID=A0A401U415_CHIPU|nr:hypothetical protein [Chiloscyllium punctatum]